MRTIVAGLALVQAAALAADVQTAIGVPPELLARPAAQGCTALRSGTYRLVSPTLGASPADQTGRVVLDASTLSFTRADGQRSVWEDRGGCRFFDPGADGTSTEYVVSQAGVFAGRVTVNGGTSHRVVLAFPEQAHSLPELAGSWNLMGLRGTPGSFHIDAGSVSFDRQGATTAAVECSNPVTWATDICTSVSGPALADVPRYAEDARGGFVSRSASRTSRLFLFRAAAGPLMLVGIGSDGSFFLGAPVQVLDLPRVGESTASWNLDMNNRLASTAAIYVTTNLVTAIDVPGRSWTRTKGVVGRADEHPEKMLANVPRDGYTTRPGGEAPIRGGGMARINEHTRLPLLGTGVIALVLPRIKYFEIAIALP